MQHTYQKVSSKFRLINTIKSTILMRTRCCFIEKFLCFTTTFLRGTCAHKCVCGVISEREHIRCGFFTTRCKPHFFGGCSVVVSLVKTWIRYGICHIAVLKNPIRSWIIIIIIKVNRKNIQI